MTLTYSHHKFLAQFNHDFNFSESTNAQESDEQSKKPEVVEDVSVAFLNPEFSFFEFHIELKFPQYVFLDKQVDPLMLLRPPLLKFV